MSSIRAHLDKALYPQFADNWDDTLFREAILPHLGPDKVVLDVGAGAGIVAAMNFKGLAQKVCGIDLDPRVEANPMLDEGRCANANEIPYADETFDVVFADNVMEHLAEPEIVLREIARVLKPGGTLLFKTPNAAHYVARIARITPHSFHTAFNRMRGRRGEDTFRTLYRANSARSVRRLAKLTGFEVRTLQRIEGRPEYLRFNPLTYLAGAAYERVVNATNLLAGIRAVIIATLTKSQST